MEADKIQAKIEALLRKAESTNFGPEAEQCIAKAHELMFRYSIDEAVLQKARGVTEEVVIVRIQTSKSSMLRYERASLLNQICKANRCRAIMTGNHTVVYGFKSDTEFVQLLYTSLCLQMYDAMEEQKYKARSVAQSNFCMGFVEVIGRRLVEVNRQVEDEYKGTGTEIVLYDRKKQVNDAFVTANPNVTTVSKRTGYDHKARNAGKEAGNRADVGSKRLSGRGMLN